MKKALDGLKVIDLTTALSGPFCTMFFGDYGAEVIKIEPIDGDQCRSWGPIDKETGESGFFCNVNRNKKGGTLNLKSEKGLQMFYDLVKDADFLCENYKGGVTQKLKIDYETIRKVNPKIIYVSGSGFGQTSPISHRPCYDAVAQAMGGLTYMTGLKENEGPVKAGPSIADHVSGIYQFVGAMVALYHREKTGEGQLVDVAMVDTIFSMLENAVPNYTLANIITERNGNIDPSISPFDSYKCKDGFVVLGVGNDRLFKKLCCVIGREDLFDDPRYATNDLRFQNYIPKLQKIIGDYCSKYTKEEIEEIMDKAGIPCGSVLNVKEAIESPQIKSREMIVETTHPVVGKIGVQGIVAKLSATPGTVDFPSPILGQHNCEIFNLTEEEAKKLHEDGVI